MENKKVFIALIVLCLLASGKLTYDFFFKVPTLKLAVTEWGGYAPAVYAQVLGLYEKNNIPIEVIRASKPDEGLSWMLNEKVDGISAVLTDVIALRGRGAPVKVVLFADYSLDGDSIVSRPEYKSILSLKGKTIGIDGLNSFSHIFVLQILEKFKLSERDVFFKVVPFEKVTELLQENVIQAAHTWVPELREALSAGNNRIATAGDLPGTILDCIVFNEEIIKSNPDLLRKFVDVFYEAQRRMLEDPHSAAEQMKYFYKNNSTVFDSSFREFHFISQDENKKRIDPADEDSFFKIAVKLNEFYLKRGQTNENSLHEDIVAKGIAK